MTRKTFVLFEKHLGPNHRTTDRENERLRKMVGRFEDELKRARSPCGMPKSKRLKVNIRRKVTEEPHTEKREDTIRHDPNWLATSAPRPPQAPYKVRPGFVTVNLDKDLIVPPFQPYVAEEGAPISSPQRPLRYGSYRPPMPVKPSEFQPLLYFPAPTPLATRPVAPKTCTTPSPVRNGHRAHHVDQKTTVALSSAHAWA